jgi:hypothetical protein
MKTYRVVEVYIHVFLTFALFGVGRTASRPCSFKPGKGAPGTHFIRGVLDPRAGLDDIEE